MQADINRIIEKCETWSMKLSPEKCKKMQLGNQNDPRDYFIANRKLGTTDCEMGLRVLVSSDGTWHKQVCSAASKANRVLGLMKSIFSCWFDDIARIIYPTFIRPHLERTSSVWNPNLKNDSNSLKSVQRRATLTREYYHLPF